MVTVLIHFRDQRDDQPIVFDTLSICWLTLIVNRRVSLWFWRPLCLYAVLQHVAYSKLARTGGVKLAG